MTILRVVYTLMFKNDIVLLSFRNSIHYFQTGNKIECDFFLGCILLLIWIYIRGKISLFSSYLHTAALKTFLKYVSD